MLSSAEPIAFTARNAMAEVISVEVCYASPERQRLVALIVPAGATVAEAVARSGLLEEFPEIVPGANKLGIYGKIVPAGKTLHDGDRVEIYRPLSGDAKERRRRRAALAPLKKAARSNAPRR
jgi:uncharacterized protein